jgi:predicted amidophosphoribosyltransferase
LISLAAGKNIEIKFDEYKIRKENCTRCSEEIPSGNKFCGRCALPIILSEQYMKETDLEEKNRSLELKIESIEQTMNQKFNKLMLMIQKNPKLAMIKSDVLLGKIYET